MRTVLASVAVIIMPTSLALLLVICSPRQDRYRGRRVVAVVRHGGLIWGT